MHEMLAAFLRGFGRLFRRCGVDGGGGQPLARTTYRESGYMAGYAGIIDFMKDGGRK